MRWDSRVNTTGDGWLFMNTNSQLVFDTSRQASDTGTGNAHIDFTDGSASFAVGNFAIGSTGAFSVYANTVTQIHWERVGRIERTNNLQAGLNEILVLSGGLDAVDSGPSIAFSSNYGTAGLYPDWKLCEIGGIFEAGHSWSGGFQIRTNPGTTDHGTTLRTSIDHDGNLKHGDGVWTNYTKIDNLGAVTINTGTAAALTIGRGAAGVDYQLVFDGETSDGVVTWMEDEDYFLFGDDINMNEKAITNFSQIAMKSSVEATISSGAITITEGHIKVETEGGADNDDLDTINSTQSGEILFLLPSVDTHTVRLRNGVGNIFLKHQVDSSHLSFSSPQGIGTATRYAGGGFYDFATTSVTLDEGSLTQTFGTANVSYAAHASIVSLANGTVDTGTVSIVVSGTSIDDEGNRSTGDSETVLADITAAGSNGYHETTKKWIGTVTFTLTETVDDPTAYTISFNYGLSKYEDFGNQSFTVTGLQVVGEAGANDTGFNMILFHHSPTGWTYAGSGFVPGGTQLANMNSDHDTEINLSDGEPFAWKRTDLNTDVAGNNGEGVVFRLDTSSAKAVESMSGVIWVHTQPAFSYLSDTKQHLIFMKHGPNWLEL